MTVHLPHPLVLASASPRRQAFLRALGLPFTIRTAGIDETPHLAESPADLARRLSRQKAQAVARYAPRALILAADTVVTLDGDVLGKPATPAEARAMLTRLRGRTHRVLSAVTVLHAESNRRYTTLSDTAVLMRPYTPAEVDAYIATGDPFDKAGGYAIQHPQFSPVARIEGCYAGVVGFPVGHVAEALAHFGVTFPPLAPLCAAFTGKPCCLATT